MSLAPYDPPGSLYTLNIATTFPAPQKMAAARAEVAELIRREVGATADHGTNQHSEGPRITKSSESDTATYALRRLKRDHSERVVRGEISAHAAAIEAGSGDLVVPVITDDSRRRRARRPPELLGQRPDVIDEILAAPHAAG